MPRAYPINLILADQPVLLVGAGAVAGRKLGDLLAAGARVKVVAPQLGRSVAARRHSIELKRRNFRQSDLLGMKLVVAATDDQRLNRRISALARRHRIPINVVDRPELCTFYLPARLARGPLLLTISTGGAAPVFSRFLRRRLQKELPQWVRFARFLGRARALLRRRVKEGRQRQQLLRRLAGEGCFAVFQRGRPAELQTALSRALGRELGKELGRRGNR